MVATRSQEHATPGHDLQILPENRTPSTQSGKRKRKTDPPYTASSQSRAKQQKTADQPSEPSPGAIVTAVLIPPPPSGFYDGQNEDRNSSGDFSTTNAQMQAEDMASASPLERRESQDQKMIEESHTFQAKASLSAHERDAEKDIEMQASKTSMLANPAGHTRPLSPTASAPPLKKQKKKKKTKPSDPDAPTDTISPTNPLVPKPKTHKRFHSEEPPPSSPNPEPAQPPSNPEKAEQDNKDDDDDDTAPETELITHPSLASTSASASAAAARAQKEAAKQKRRARDSLLKAQKQHKRGRERKHKHKSKERGDIVPSPPSPPSPSALDQEGEGGNGELAIPDLLPLELLAEEPAPRAPTPPFPSEHRPAQQTSLKAQKRKLLDQDPRPRKDIKVGKYKVRVLEALVSQTGLPPKASKNSKAVRERWLVGREGAKGKMCVERRGWGVGGGGFVRR
ncbi:MAG: hypothetical protein LQ351_002805 [Letrouitia transgressa]|nr:MAG: hypothetical protein LQ351_002805 [Letrouitia transgressa]